MASVKAPQGECLSAFTTTSATTASRMIMIASTDTIVSSPARRPTSSLAIWPSERPSRRSEKNKITKSCTQPPSTAPATSHSVPGR